MKHHYKCDFCSKVFSRFHILKNHIENGHLFEYFENINQDNNDAGIEENYKCEICSKEFFQSHNLKNHLENAHKEKSTKKPIHKCEVCSKTFTRIQNLKRHFKKNHGDFETEDVAKTMEEPFQWDLHFLGTLEPFQWNYHFLSDLAWN